jgi:hypothetical protein
MTDASQPRFDPRHDPLFQRGYDSAAPTPPAAAFPAASADPRDAATPARPEADARTYSHLGLLELGLDAAETPWPRRNPYVRALWIIGVTLVVGGIGLAWQITANSANINYSGGEMPFALILQQLSWTVIPSMVTVGIATIVALVFWEALHWRAPDQRADSPGRQPTHQPGETSS